MTDAKSVKSIKSVKKAKYVAKPKRYFLSSLNTLLGN